ncbi:hypothetical protein GE061_019229 [Apolygus lucorum]|uniref:Uncharacterized protein n=1 Tax=Apolygus lucorum TaxID=248454 RepID=A0A6A4JJE5_APOLU|nr:hypothetical protein GE061_019229 [Apolygus lucorum]
MIRRHGGRRGSHGLRLTSLEVPRHANIGTSVLLGCYFEITDNKLYSVKWYKDDYEFFRFMPDNHPNSQIFPVNGIHLDNSQSDINHVKLDMLEYSSSGTYKCEVSTEGPAFDTVFTSHNMTVFAYPDRPPIITGAEEYYSIGDYITVNCSSGRSNPEPVLSWFINNQKADNFLLDHNSPKIRHGNPNHMGELYSRTLGMRVKADRMHFKGSKMTISLKCQSSVTDMSTESTVVEARLATASSSNILQPQQISGNNSGSLNRVSVLSVIAIFQVILRT